MMNSKSELYATRELFASYTHYNTPLSYDEWLAVADDLKAAVLYCQFFDQITLAWYKLKSVYSSEADGVDEAIQYLQKNVEVIKKDPKRFTSAYIYKIMYNCLYCLCRDPNRYKKVYENECSNIQVSSDGEYDLFDTFIDHSSTVDSAVLSIEKEKMWRIIESSGRKTVIVVAELLGEDYDWTDANPDVRRSNEPWRMKWKKHNNKVDLATWRSIHKRAKLAADTEGAVRILSETYLGDDKYRVEYEEYVKDNYKGVKKFSKADHESVSEEERAEIMEFLRSIFGKHCISFS